MSSDGEKHSRDARRDVLKLWGPLGILTLVAFAVALHFADAPPPSRVSIATGPKDGGYALAGARFAKELEDAGIAVDLVATEGSLANLELLRTGQVDVALVQGGLARDDEPELAGVASLYLEPLWIFDREPVARLAELDGRAVDAGEEGSGTRALADRLFGGAGIEIDHSKGEASTVVRVAAARSPLVRELLTSDDLVPASLERAEGIVRTLTYLEHVRIPAGSIDLAADLPREP
ncbi:MAG: TAXI family TRAP transporter solute-binding subunit, partial [Planctomycetota bacterium]